MDISEDVLRKWTVPTLRKFLKSKGIPSSGYAKKQLQDMVLQAVRHPELVEDTEPLEDENALKKRRTVQIHNQEIVFPDPTTLTEWQEDLATIPCITKSNCYVYLLMNRGWSAQRIQAFEKESGYHLYWERHIQQVKLKKMDYNMTCIKARCTRQTNQNEAPYEVWMIASSNGDISTAGCECIG